MPGRPHDLAEFYIDLIMAGHLYFAAFAEGGPATGFRSANLNDKACMSTAAEILNKGIRRVVLSQMVLTVVVAGGFLLFAGWSLPKDPSWLPAGILDALSALYGGGTAILSTWWLGRSVQRAGEVARQNQQSSQWALYAGAVQRFVGTLVLLGLGLGGLKLAPIPLIVAFAVAQFGFIASAGGIKPPPG